MKIPVILAMAVLAEMVLSPQDAPAAERMYLASGTARARALAMGSAYSAIEDDFPAGLFNPAGFRMNATRSERRLRLFFNPAGSAAAFSDYTDRDLDYVRDDKLTTSESLLAASMLVKGAGFTTPAVDFGLSLHEPVIRGDLPLATRGRFMSAESMTRESFHAAFMNVKIASTISLGVTGLVFQRRIDDGFDYKSGYIFGVLVDTTSRLKVGLSYHQLPKALGEPRSDLEHIMAGTVSGGVSYYPDLSTTVTLDVRNLNKENTNTSLEIHSGIERVIASRFALRAGYFREKETRRDVVSFGAGILPGWERLKKFRTSSRNDILSYTFIMEESAVRRQWHMVSLFFVY